MEKDIDPKGHESETDDDDEDKESSDSKDTSKDSERDVQEDESEPEQEELEKLPEPEPIDEEELLTSDESELVIHEYLEGRTAEIKQELDGVESDSPEEAEALANAEYINALRQKTGDQEPIDDEMLDAALDEVVAELELPTVDTTPPPPEADAVVPDDEPDPTGPSSPIIRRFATHGPSGSPSTPNTQVAPTPANNEVIETTSITRSRSGDLLLGGIIGYLIGRRRGRKNTERRLLPIQHQLETEVEKLTDSIEQREAKIRELVRQQTKTSPELAPVLVAKVENKYEQKRQERAEQQAKKTENMGKMGLASAEVLPERRKLTDDEKPRKAVEIMTVDELLEIAAKVSYDGVSLKEIYENGRIDAFGLRRVVTEFLRGKNHEKLLAVYVTPEIGQLMRSNEAFNGMKQSQNLHPETGKSAFDSSSDHPLSSYPDLQQKISQTSSTKSIVTGILIGLILVGLLLLIFA